jgi:predicted NAD-dependent protein-ADP-ribosyltransferase YbiA (DUF1768 family)/rhodanese-related sulfurtransferase
MIYGIITPPLNHFAMGGPAIIDNVTYVTFDTFFLRNFSEGVIQYASPEHYFQSKKTDTGAHRRNIQDAASGMDAWRRGQDCELRGDWEDAKLSVMYAANFLKFTQNSDLALALMETEGVIRFPESDAFWGSSGDNHLGTILETVRAYLRGDSARYVDLLRILHVTPPCQREAPVFTYMEQDVLVQKLSADCAVVVIDVREDDHVGGHICGSYHIPAADFHARLSEVLHLVRTADVVVLHCQESIKRSPRCARMLAAQLSAPLFVLKGGFDQWVRRFWDTDLVQEYDEEFWYYRTDAAAAAVLRTAERSSAKLADNQ